MDGHRDYHIKGSKSEKDKYGITYMWNLKKLWNELIYNTETDSQIQKTNFQLPKERLGEGVN